MRLRRPWRRGGQRIDREPAAGRAEPRPRDAPGVEVDGETGQPPGGTVSGVVADPPCSQCGRTQYPLVGGWDPPICADCDAAANEDTIEGEELRG